MSLEFAKCDRHQKKSLKFLCTDLNCGNNDRILCKKCLKEKGNNNHIRCQENKKIMKIKKFQNNMNKSLKPSIDLLNESEKFLKLYRRADLFCAEMRQKIRSTTQGHFILKQKIEALDIYPSNQNLLNVLQDENFSQKQIQDQFPTDLNFSLTANFENINQQMEEIEKKIQEQIKQIELQSTLKVEPTKNVQQKRNNNPVVQVQSKSEIKSNKFDNKISSFTQTQQTDSHILEIASSQQLQLVSQFPQKQIQEPSQVQSLILNFDKSIPIKEQGISNLSGQGASKYLNSSIISNSSNKIAKKELFKEDEINVTDQIIKSIKVINENFLLLMTDKELFGVTITRKLYQKLEYITKSLYQSDQKMLNQTLYDQELIFQTQDLKIHYMNLNTERITHPQISALPNLYSYSRKYQSLYLLSPDKQTIKKYNLKLEIFELEKEITIQNSADLIYLKHKHLGLLTISKNGTCQEYDASLQSAKYTMLQYKELTDILIEDNYICYVENKKFSLELKQTNTTIHHQLNEPIKQFSAHHNIQGQVILISCILNNDVFYYIRSDEQGNNDFGSEKLRQSTYQCSALHQSFKKQPILYLANKGNIISYRIRIENQSN